MDPERFLALGKLFNGKDHSYEVCYDLIQAAQNYAANPDYDYIDVWELLNQVVPITRHFNKDEMARDFATAIRRQCQFYGPKTLSVNPALTAARTQIYGQYDAQHHRKLLELWRHRTPEASKWLEDQIRREQLLLDSMVGTPVLHPELIAKYATLANNYSSIRILAWLLRYPNPIRAAANWKIIREALKGLLPYAPLFYVMIRFDHPEPFIATPPEAPELQTYYKHYQTAFEYLRRSTTKRQLLYHIIGFYNTLQDILADLPEDRLNNVLVIFRELYEDDLGTMLSEAIPLMYLLISKYHQLEVVQEFLNEKVFKDAVLY